MVNLAGYCPVAPPLQRYIAPVALSYRIEVGGGDHYNCNLGEVIVVEVGLRGSAPKSRS